MPNLGRKTGFDNWLIALLKKQGKWCVNEQVKKSSGRKCPRDFLLLGEPIIVADAQSQGHLGHGKR